jgi:hypothetical protein
MAVANSELMPTDARGSGSALCPLPYHEAMVGYLQRWEDDLWQWFSSGGVQAERRDAARLELLKSTYRLERESQPQLYAVAEAAAAALGLALPVTAYQLQDPLGMNASLAYIPGEIHVVLQGPSMEALTAGELGALLGHEFGHFMLYEGWERRFHIAAEILAAMAADRLAREEHLESARRFALYTEVFCDRAALTVCGELATAVAMQLKVQTGLASVDPAAYLRQAEEIFRLDQPKADGATHPEGFIRTRALQLWQHQGGSAAAEIARMIEGTPELGRLDLLGKLAVAATTREVLAALLRPTWFQTETVLGHARLFFEDFAPGQAVGSLDPVAATVARWDKSLQDYLCYVLLDFATVDRSLEDLPLAAALALSGRLGLAKPFGAVAVKELGLRKRPFERLQATAAGKLAQAEGRAGA